MKKTTRRILAMLLCLIMVFGSAPAIGAASLLGVQASAADTVTFEQYGNLYYTIGQEGGSSYASVRFCEPKTVGEVVIPATLGGYPVKGIGSYAFATCTEVISVIIPTSVEWIGSTAFYGCKSLTQITLPNGLKEIEDWAFFKCSALESVVLPNTLVSIGDGAFMDCSALKSIRVPTSVTEVGDYAFAGCSCLTSVEYCPTDYYYLYEDEELNLEYCLDKLFWVGGGRANGLFQDCTAIEEIKIGSGVLFFDFYDFIGHPTLQNITVDTNNKIYSSLDGVLFDKSQKYLLTYPAANPRTEYVIPDSVLTGFMQYANNLKVLTIGANYLSDLSIFGDSDSAPSSDNYFSSLAYSSLAYNNSITTFKVSPKHPFFVADEFGVLYIKGNDPEFGEFRTIFGYPLGKSDDDIYVLPDNVPFYVIIPWMLVKASEKDSNTGLRKYEPVEIRAHVSLEQLAMIMSSYTESEAYIDPDNETTMEHEGLLSDLTETNRALSLLRFSRICIDATDEEIKTYFLTNLGDEKYYNKMLEILNTDFSVDLSQWQDLMDMLANTQTENEAKQSSQELLVDYYSNLFREQDVSQYGRISAEWINSHGCLPDGTIIEEPLNPEDSKFEVEDWDDLAKYGRVYTALLYGMDLYATDAYLTQEIYADQRSGALEGLISGLDGFLGFSEGVLRTHPHEIIHCDGNHNGHVHMFGDWVTIKEPTETEEGLKERVCSECGEKEQQKIDKIQTITKKDNASGIQVSFINTVLDGNVELHVENVQDGAAFNLIQGDNIVNKAVFDITLLKDGVEVQPNGSVTVRIPISAGFDVSKCKLYHISVETMSIEEIPIRIEGNYLVFTTNHFSYYAVAETKATNPVKPISVKMDKNSLNMTYKTAAAVTANIENGEGVTVVWTSSNEKVAKVDQNGKVTATGKGTATITCTATDKAGNSVTDSCNVTVKYSWWQWLIIILLFGWIWY